MDIQKVKKVLGMKLRKGAIFEMELSDSQDPTAVKTLTQLFDSGKHDGKTRATTKDWEMVVHIDGRIANIIRSPQPPVPGPPGTPPIRVRIVVTAG